MLEVWQKENNNNCCHNFVCVWESSTTNDEHEKKIARIFMSCDMRNFSLISLPRNIIKRAKKNHGRKPTSNRHDKMCGGEKIIINCLMHSSLAQHHPLISNHHHHHQHRVKISSFLACSKRNDGESVKPFFPYDDKKALASERVI